MNHELYEQVAFVGEVLGPFYLYDPEDANVQPAYQAFANLDASAAAHDWPFLEAPDVLPLLLEMQEGIGGEKPSEQLTWEYRRLFVGPAQKVAAPWGSVYTDREGIVFGESTMALRQWMRQQEVIRLGNKNDPEDHIGLMLILMARIAQNKPELLKDYCEQHFFTWSSHYLKLLESRSTQQFFEGLAALTLLSLEGIQEAFGFSVEYPKFHR